MELRLSCTNPSIRYNENSLHIGIYGRNAVLNPNKHKLFFLIMSTTNDRLYVSPSSNVMNYHSNAYIYLYIAVFRISRDRQKLLYHKPQQSYTRRATRQIWGIWKLRPAYSPETPNWGQNRWCFVLCDLEIWWMTLENNRAHLLCCFKLCATFDSHRWIQTGVAVRKRPIWVKFDDF